MQTTSPPDRTPTAAVEAAAWNHAIAAAQDPKKLRRSVRVIRAALELGVLTLDDITDKAA